MGRKTLHLASLVFVFAFVASCTQEGDQVIIESSAGDLQGLEVRVSEGYPLIPDLNIPLKCIAHFNSNAEQDWTNQVQWEIGDSWWGTVSGNGVFHANRPGIGLINVRHPDGWTADATLIVSDLQSLDVSIEEDILFRGDATPANVTALTESGQVTHLHSSLLTNWTFVTQGILRFAGNGILEATNVGQTAVAVTLTGVTSIPQIVTVDSVLSISCAELSSGPYLPFDTVSYSARATTCILGELTLTDRVDWYSSDPFAMLHLNDGMFVPSRFGFFDVMAEMSSVESPLQSVEVWNVTGLSIDPEFVPDTLNRLDSLVFTATGEVQNHGSQNLTNRVEWVLTNPIVGRFISPGFFLARRSGQSEIYARLEDVISPSTTINVFAPAVIDDGFESYPMGTFLPTMVWDVWTDGGATRVEITDMAATGIKGCSFIDSASSYTAGISTFPSAGNVITGSISVDVHPGPGLWIWVGGPNSSRMATVIEFSYGEITAIYSTIGTYDPDSWYNVRVEFDCTTDRLDVYIDDVLVLENEYFYYAQSSLDNFSAFSSPATEFGIGSVDNFWVEGEEVMSAAHAPEPVSATGEIHCSTPRASVQDLRRAKPIQ